ncbi:MAG: tetratricopeptide repeat protein, partial [Myxococcaceae bacterium]|nr:tetratricopeptide repeat protein [Myxococcaceae bacterium]
MERKGREPVPPELSEQLRKVDRLRRGGRYEEALSHIRQLADAHPQKARVLLELGLTLGVWGGAHAEALPWYSRALELAPGLLSARLHRALSLAALGRHAEALGDFDALEAADYRKPLVLHTKRAESHEALGQLAEAERDWTLALAEDANNPWLLQRRADTRVRLSRLAEAEEDLTRALATQHGAEVDPELLLLRGELRARRGDTAGARADFEAGLAALREGDPVTLAE